MPSCSTSLHRICTMACAKLTLSPHQSCVLAMPRRRAAWPCRAGSLLPSRTKSRCARPRSAACGPGVGLGLRALGYLSFAGAAGRGIQCVGSLLTYGHTQQPFPANAAGSQNPSACLPDLPRSSTLVRSLGAVSSGFHSITWPSFQWLLSGRCGSAWVVIRRFCRIKQSWAS